MGFSHAYGVATERAEAVRTMREAFDMGYTMFDTAECYTGVFTDGSVSYNEELVGEALHDVRDSAVLFDGCNYRSLLFTNPLFRGLFHF